jgi:hypothetical protein
MVKMFLFMNVNYGICLNFHFMIFLVVNGLIIVSKSAWFKLNKQILIF